LKERNVISKKSNSIRIECIVLYPYPYAAIVTENNNTKRRVLVIVGVGAEYCLLKANPAKRAANCHELQLQPTVGLSLSLPVSPGRKYLRKCQLLETAWPQQQGSCPFDFDIYIFLLDILTATLNSGQDDTSNLQLGS